MAGVRVVRVPGTPGDREQGALDWLEVIASSGALIAAIKVLPEFLRARRSDLKIKVRLKNGREVTLEASNIGKVLPMLERLIDDGT